MHVQDKQAFGVVEEKKGFLMLQQLSDVNILFLVEDDLLFPKQSNKNDMDNYSEQNEL